MLAILGSRRHLVTAAPNADQVESGLWPEEVCYSLIVCIYRRVCVIKSARRYSGVPESVVCCGSRARGGLLLWNSQPVESCCTVLRDVVM